MRRLLLTGIVLLTLLPIASAETIWGTYEAPGGAQFEQYFLAAYPCGLYDCDFDGDGADDYGIGGNHFRFQHSWNRLEVSVTDTVSYDGPAYIINLWGSPEVHEHKCGRVSYASGTAFREASVFMFALYVEEGLFNLCVGTSGVIAAKGY